MGDDLKKLTLTIPIMPTPKARPRAQIFSGRVHIFTPKTTADYERKIASYYQQSSKAFKFDKDQAICVSIVFGMPIPKSTPKSRKQAMAQGIIRHTKRPDIDNLAKAVLDALNGVAWDDDSQIVKLTASKEYSVEPYVYLYIHESVD